MLQRGRRGPTVGDEDDGVRAARLCAAGGSEIGHAGCRLLLRLIQRPPVVAPECRGGGFVLSADSWPELLRKLLRGAVEPAEMLERRRVDLLRPEWLLGGARPIRAAPCRGGTGDGPAVGGRAGEASVVGARGGGRRGEEERKGTQNLEAMTYE